MSERLRAPADVGAPLDDWSREWVERANSAELRKANALVGAATNPTVFAAPPLAVATAMSTAALAAVDEHGGVVDAPVRFRQEEAGTHSAGPTSSPEREKFVGCRGEPVGAGLDARFAGARA